MAKTILRGVMGFTLAVVITAGCESARSNGETDAVRSVVAVTETESLAFAGMEAEYYVIAYTHCKKGFVALAEEYETRTNIERVAQVHAARYGDVPSIGAYEGCRDAIVGAPNRFWVTPARR
jgi:hypothetical protein